MTILLSERHNSALLLTLNRPEAMNALSSALVDALREAVREASKDLTLRGIRYAWQAMRDRARAAPRAAEA